MVHKKDGKLVRDRIPEIMRAQGKAPQARTLSMKEYEAALRMKLLEEAEECVNAKGKVALAEELADIEEVLAALRATHGIGRSEVQRIQRKKRKARGGFDDHIFLIGNKK